jgi:chloramphenicol 3-O phosphotransferase
LYCWTLLSASHVGSAGVGVILEHILFQPCWLRDAVEQLHSCRVLFVYVHCPPEELARREAARERRDPSSGQAVAQFQALARLRERNPFDLVVDTTAVQAPPERYTAMVP